MVRAGEGLVKRRQEGARASLFATIHYELAQFHVESLIIVLPSFLQVGARGGASAGAGPPTPSLLLASCSPLSLSCQYACCPGVVRRRCRLDLLAKSLGLTGWLLLAGVAIQTHLEVVFAAWSLLLFLDLTSSSSGFLVSCGSGVSRLSRPGVRRRWGSSRLFAGLLLSLVGAILEMVASSPWQGFAVLKWSPGAVLFLVALHYFPWPCNYRDPSCHLPSIIPASD
ncbi:hypothetical protein DY000_02039410 [Brassica cretica]|uniref:Uncharacterized protein n=1 Tax=Brassica cretica TaxID=69181 RepID=A0ABQ7BIB2_BRACR|nr:hypothetical protein DY000_02039410 [Brassica cretica]